MVNPAAQMQMQVAVLGGMQSETNPLGPSPFDKTAPPPITDLQAVVQDLDGCGIP